MPDTPSPQAGLDAITKALDLLKDAWPGADADPAAAAAAPAKPKNEEAETGAARARRKYDKTLRWVLAVFSAVGLLVFGSVPFTDLDHVDPLLLLVSLGAVGLGLAVIILATATGLEMQDASLGELAQTFARRSEWRRRYVLTPWRRPQVVANRDLKAIIESPDVAEAQAHLGPGVGTVGQLVQRIGEIERAAMTAYIGWDGDWLPRQDGQKAVDPTTLQTAVGGSVAAKLARANLAHQELERLTKALATLREQLPTEKDVAPDARLVQEIERLSALLVSAASAVPPLDYLTDAARSTALDELRDHYRAHRTMVLQESLVAQIRAKFRTALCWLLLGAVLTGGGGITYAYAVANPTTDGSIDNPVAVTLMKGEAAFTAYDEEKCWDGEAGAPIAPALLTRSSDADGRQDGDFTFLPLAGPCAGDTFEVEEGQGTYVAWSAPDGADEDPAEEPGAKKPRIGARVNVTILPDTPAYVALGDCRTRPADVTGVTARLLGANDADDDQDGPFTVVLLAGQCAARTVFVREADGRYRVLEDPEPAATTDE